jgi:predicted GH43/DUF377 family glycosyl hydrolase
MDVLPVTRHDDVRLTPDPTRRIAKLFWPREESYPDGRSRFSALLERVRDLPDEHVDAQLASVAISFGDRHRDLDGLLERHELTVIDQLRHLEIDVAAMTRSRRRLVTAYFSQEYSIEAAALTNPSMVVAPDQDGVEPGEVRFVMSLRAIGEGHVSSIEFRTGVAGPGAAIRLDPPCPFAAPGERSAHLHDKSFFDTKLRDLGALNDIEAMVLADLSDRFTIEELDAAVERLDDSGVERSISGETTRLLHWLASSNYRVAFDPGTEMSERVLFPNAPTESHGMEDARFVRFVDDCGTVTYYATYTAFDGRQILPQLLETHDFEAFRVSTLSGAAAHNKGLALFPRRIDGQFVALGRHDNVNNFVMRSNDVRSWRSAELIQEPTRPWEMMQLGNCGSPLETEHGWLVITHGVGPFRTYSLGAVLLDLADPTKVVACLDQPILSAAPDEREGYVPNVVYSCGSMLHDGHVVLPYGCADSSTRIATIELDSLLDRFR